MKRKLVTNPQRGGHATSHGTTQGSIRVGQEAEGKKESVGESLYCGFIWKEQMRQGKQA